MPVRTNHPNRDRNRSDSRSTRIPSNFNAERLMFLFMCVVIAVGLHHWVALRDLHSDINAIDERVRDEPGSHSANFVRQAQQTQTQTQSQSQTQTKTAKITTETISASNLIKILETGSAKINSFDKEKDSASEGGEEEGSKLEKVKKEDNLPQTKPAKITPETIAASDLIKSLETGPAKINSFDKEKASVSEGGEEEGKNSDNLECMKEKRLNVALFYADDWTMQVLGKLNKYVKTPNIDAMADNGMMFTNNCVTSSVCWLSRSTLATGTYAAIHKHTMPFDDAKFETKNWADTMYPLMREGSNSGKCQDGYYSGLFGKWHKLEVDVELRAAFDERIVYYGQHWEERDSLMYHVTELNKIDSVRFLNNWQNRFKDKEEKEKNPFFLTTSFFATHARDGLIPSYQPQNSTRSRFYPDFIDLPVPKTATDEHWKQLPEFLREGNEGRTRWKNRFEPKDIQKNIKDIYSMATEVDAAIGTIVDKIKSLGVYDDTILIFTTDNGNLHGEHGLAEKWYPFEEAMRVPLVIQDPRMPKERRGTMSDAWTLNVDLAPTILAAGGIPRSSFMQGRDISDLYLNDDPEHASLSVDELKEKVEWRKDWFYEFNLGQSNDGIDHPWESYIDASFALVTDEWKYVYWPQKKYEQLFHRSVDPYDEWDLLNKIFRPKMMHSFVDGNLQINRTGDSGNQNGCCDTVQTTMAMYEKMKARYAVLKDRAQNGERV